jgi:hypothetical protein
MNGGNTYDSSSDSDGDYDVVEEFLKERDRLEILREKRLEFEKTAKYREELMSQIKRHEVSQMREQKEAEDERKAIDEHTQQFFQEETESKVFDYFFNIFFLNHIRNFSGAKRARPNQP